MAIYAGETVTFKLDATNVDDARTPLVEADVDTATIEIRDSDGDVVATSSLTWNDTDGEWRYVWTTSDSGTFKAKLRLQGVGFDVWEYSRVRVKSNPTTFL